MFVNQKYVRGRPATCIAYANPVLFATNEIFVCKHVCYGGLLDTYFSPKNFATFFIIKNFENKGIEKKRRFVSQQILRFFHLELYMAI